MASEVISLIQAVSLDFIKIVGSAAVAAYAGYRGAMIQLTLKLQEIDKNQQYQARESIFSHLREQLAHLDTEAEKWNAEIGRAIGFAAGSKDSNREGEVDEYVQLLGRATKGVARLIPLEVATTLGEMRMLGLESSEHFKALAALEQLPAVELDGMTYVRLKESMLSLFDTYNLLGACTRMLLHKQMERVFAPYMHPKK